MDASGQRQHVVEVSGGVGAQHAVIDGKVVELAATDDSSIFVIATDHHEVVVEATEEHQYVIPLEGETVEIMAAAGEEAEVIVPHHVSLETSSEASMVVEGQDQHIIVVQEPQ
jgi:hypothetical protein